MNQSHIMSASIHQSNQMYSQFDAPAPTVSLQQWAEAESSNLDAQETIRHLKEIVIPNLQDRQKLQNEYWKEQWSGAQAEIEELKKKALSDNEFFDNIQASYQENIEQLEEADHTVRKLRERNQLLENGVTRSRVARRDTNYYKKENKRLKAQLAESQSWREHLGSCCYDHGARYEEEYNKRVIIQEKMKELEEKYEMAQQNVVESEKHVGDEIVRTDKYKEIVTNLRDKIKDESRKKIHAEKLANELKIKLTDAKNTIDELKEQVGINEVVIEQWSTAYNWLLKKYETDQLKYVNENDALQKDTKWDNNYIHVLPNIHETDDEYVNSAVEQPPRAGIGWVSENQTSSEEMV